MRLQRVNRNETVGLWTGGLSCVTAQQSSTSHVAMEAPVIMLKQTLSTDASQSNQVNAKEKTKAAGAPSVSSCGCGYYIHQHHFSTLADCVAYPKYETVIAVIMMIPLAPSIGHAHGQVFTQSMWVQCYHCINSYVEQLQLSHITDSSLALLLVYNETWDGFVRKQIQSLDPVMLGERKDSFSVLFKRAVEIRQQSSNAQRGLPPKWFGDVITCWWQSFMRTIKKIFLGINLNCERQL